jgi:hypothetical protein
MTTSKASPGGEPEGNPLTTEERKRLVERHFETMAFRIAEQNFYLLRLPQLCERIKKLQNGGPS